MPFQITPVQALSNGQSGVLFDHMFVNLGTISGGPIGLVQSVSGAGAASPQVTPPDATSFGVLGLSTGTTTTGRGGMLTPALTAFRFGAGQLSAAMRFQLPALLDGTESGAVYIGFGDSLSGSPVDGAYLYWDNTQANFRVRTRNNSVETDSDTGVAPVAATWYTIEITVNAAGTAVTFALTPQGGATTVTTIATNIPTAVNRETGLIANIIKSAGTTARSLYIDWVRLAWSGF